VQAKILMGMSQPQQQEQWVDWWTQAQLTNASIQKDTNDVTSLQDVTK
jgi:hypothetical protein